MERILQFLEFIKSNIQWMYETQSTNWNKKKHKKENHRQTKLSLVHAHIPV